MIENFGDILETRSPIVSASQNAGITTIN